MDTMATCQQRTSNSSLVSILIPVYGHEPYLSETLHSITKDKFNNFEIIIVIENISNRTENIIRTSELEMKIVNYSGSDGISGALNRGLEYCDGKYIARIDADDKFINNRLLKQVNYMENNPHVGVLGSSYKTISEDGKYLSRVTPPEEHISICWGLLLENCLAHPTIMIRRSVLAFTNRVYRSEYNFAEDYDLWTRLVDKTTFHNLNSALIEYRIDSDTAVNEKQEDLSAQISQREILEILPQMFSKKEIKDMIDLRRRRIATSDKESAILNTHQLYSEFTNRLHRETADLRRYFVSELIKDIIASDTQKKDVYYLIDLIRRDSCALCRLIKKAWHTSLRNKERSKNK